MKKNLVLLCGALVMAAAAVVASLSFRANAEPSLMALNIEALSHDEGGGGCDYDNGYDSFSGSAGGAYDCCKVWRDLLPMEGKYCMKEVR